MYIAHNHLWSGTCDRWKMVPSLSPTTMIAPKAAFAAPFIGSKIFFADGRFQLPGKKALQDEEPHKNDQFMTCYGIIV